MMAMMLSFGQIHWQNVLVYLEVSKTKYLNSKKNMCICVEANYIYTIQGLYSY